MTKYDGKNALVFENEIQAMLWSHELCGQISDGAWENTTPHDHWRAWCDAEVFVGFKLGRNFSAIKDNYMLNRKDLLEVIGERMLFKANLAVAFPGLWETSRVPDSVQEISRTKVEAEKDHKHDFWLREWCAYDDAGFYNEEETQKLLKCQNAEYVSQADMMAELKRMRKIIKIYW